MISQLKIFTELECIYKILSTAKKKLNKNNFSLFLTKMIIFNLKIFLKKWGEFFSAVVFLLLYMEGYFIFGKRKKSESTNSNSCKVICVRTKN